MSIARKVLKKNRNGKRQYKNKYDEMLDKEVIEAYTNLGRYLPNLSYLDKSWVNDKVSVWLQKVAGNIGKLSWTGISPLEKYMMTFMS